jgi:hypothetical protein
MGSLLFDRGVNSSSCHDALNLIDAPLVQSIHQAYAVAGTEVLETLPGARYACHPGGDGMVFSCAVLSCP